jgi:hypothetical protein
MHKAAVTISDEPRTFSDSILATLSGLARTSISGRGEPADCSEALTPQRATEPGVLVTVPLTFSGDHLLVEAELINTCDLRGCLIDGGGEVIPGFEDENSIVTRSHASWYEVHWYSDRLRGQTMIMNNVDPPAALCLTLSHGFLFAFRIVDSLAPSRIGDTSRDQPLELSNHPQLFLDDYLIARMINLGRKPVQPLKHPDNPLMVNEHPWERLYMQTSSVVYDDEADRFQAWYWASAGPDSPFPRVCDGYAESKDGVQWVKPMIGREPIGPYREHNLIVPAKLARSVFRDPEDPDRSRLYKGSFGSHSPDGITWINNEEDGRNWLQAVGKNDTVTSFVRWKGEYLNYVRYQGPETNTIVYDSRTGKTWLNAVFRSTGLSTSKDFRHWTTKEQIFATDEQDGYPWTQPHALCVTAYGDLLIGLLPLLHVVPEDGNNFLGSMDVQLMVSRDGRQWKRVANREVFMPCEEARPIGERAWDHHIHPTSNFVVQDDLVRIYYWGMNFRHGENRPNGSGIGALASTKQQVAIAERQYGLGLATLPADRFVSLHPAAYTAEGVLETKMLNCPEGNLFVNADPRAGSGTVKAELLDSAGAVLPGFDRESSHLSARDPLRFDVVWKQADGAVKTFLDIAQDQPIAIRFIVINCNLYAFQIA